MTRWLCLVSWLWIFMTVAVEATSYQYSYLPKTAYEHQIFPITILGTSTANQPTPEFSFDSANANQPLFKQPLVVKNGSDSFYTFYFRAEGQGFLLPSLQIQDADSQITLKGGYFPVARLKPRLDYSGVLAADMKITTSQASTFDEQHNLVTMQIEAYEANLEQMHLSASIEDGIDEVERSFAKVTGEYYAVVPASETKLKFTYFNTIKQQYVYLETPIEIKEILVAATEEELNPSEENYDRIKKDLFIALSVLFLVLFIWKRDFLYLSIAAVTLITLMTLYAPTKRICVAQGAPLYILPTSTSRMITTVDADYTARLLGQREHYYKVRYHDHIIGWILETDVCQD
jgi:hypothetical protein